MGVMLELEFEMPDVRGDEAAGDVDDVMSLVDVVMKMSLRAVSQ